jgi:hypothetical protein
MKKLSLFLALASFSAGVVLGEAINASEITKAPIAGLSIFKNGTVLVERSVEPPSEGPCYLSGDIKPYHGTFWALSDKSLKMTAFQETVISNSVSSVDTRSFAERHGGYEAVVWFVSEITTLKEELDFMQKEGAAGRVLTVQPVTDEKSTKTVYKVEGVVEKMPKAGAAVKNGMILPNPVFDGVVVRFPVGGVVRIPTANLKAVSAAGENQIETSVTRNLWKVEGAEKPFKIEYATQGMTWAPYYRMELNEGKAKLTMAADIKNEMEDFSEAEVSLVSGFPKIDMEGKDSLLNLRISLNGFLNVLDGGTVNNSQVRRDYRSNNFYSQAPMMYAKAAAADMAVEESATLGAVAQVEEKGAVNMHFQKIGKQSLKKGETLRTDIASAELEYTSKVSWNVTAMRDIDQNGYMRNLTTNAPMEVLLDGTFYCQTPQSWLNPGQEGKTTLTKALSLEPKLEENERAEEAEPKTLKLEHSTYRQVTVDGKATLKNHRKEKVTAEIILRVSGVIEKVELGEGQKETRSVSIPYGVNPVSSKTVETEIEPGATVEINYTYTSYIRY